MPPSSRGLGHSVFIRTTGIRIPLGVPFYKQISEQFSFINQLELFITQKASIESICLPSESAIILTMDYKQARL